MGDCHSQFETYFEHLKIKINSDKIPPFVLVFNSYVKIHLQNAYQEAKGTVEDFPGLAEGVHVGHHVVLPLLLFLGGEGEVDVIHLGLHLGNLWPESIENILA